MKTQRAKPFGYAQCPHHVPSGARIRTDVIINSRNEYVFRDHMKTIGKGHRVPCPGSGMVVEGEVSTHAE